MMANYTMKKIILKDKRLSTKHYTETQRDSNTNLTKNDDEICSPPPSISYSSSGICRVTSEGIYDPSPGHPTPTGVIYGSS